MKKQKCPFEGVYDLFAIRVILDSCLEKEKLECWQAYSIVTDMYQPNPKGYATGCPYLKQRI